METVCQELVQFMQLSTRLEIKLTATKNVLALTGSPDGRKFITDYHSLLEAILTLTKDENLLVEKDCYLSLVNLSTEDHVTTFLLEKYNIVPEFISVTCNAKSQFSDEASMILSNVTRTKLGSSTCLEAISNMKDMSLNKLLNVFCNVNYNTMKCNLHYLAPFFANITQLPEGRNFFLNHHNDNLRRILSFLQYEDSIIRRGGVASVLKNCCFDYAHHEWLLDEDVDLLSHLLLPLAGPEEFGEEDTEKLPLDLQYLPPNKTREPDEDIRKLLIETLLLLCADKTSRERIIAKNCCLIIKELQAWESSNHIQSNVDECEKLLQILISGEPDVENLMTYEIPAEHQRILQRPSE